MREENNNSRDEQQPKDPIEIQAVAGTTTKRRGESAEAEFISRAISLCFSVLKPWGESDRYDVLIDHGRGFWRVQVKCSTCRVGSHYRLELSRKGVCYTRAEIDFVAGNIVLNSSRGRAERYTFLYGLGSSTRIGEDVLSGDVWVPDECARLGKSRWHAAA